MRRGDWIFPAVLLACIAAWFEAFPLESSFSILDIAFDSAVLAISIGALFWLRTFRHANLEAAWKLLIFSHLICWLDCCNK